MTNYRFIIEYDGTDFEGWQAQAEGHRTVQACVSAVLARIVGAPISLTGSGRTDAGVHAQGQAANARLDTRLAPEALRNALNANLPDDISIQSLQPVADDFDARRSARSKHYRYAIWNHPVRSPLRARRSWWLRGRLDLAAMEAAAGLLQGEHDFASFQAAGSSVASTVRTLAPVSIGGRAGGDVVLDFEGDGFLRYMVRNLVGTLAEVGLGRRAPDSLSGVLAARDRAAAGATAPALGLTLIGVRYADADGLT